MSIASETFTRRQTLVGLGAGLGAGAALLAVPGRAIAQAIGPAAADPTALLDEVAWNLLGHEPERATSLGVDTGAHAALRGNGEHDDAGAEAREGLASGEGFTCNRHGRLLALPHRTVK